MRVFFLLYRDDVKTFSWRKLLRYKPEAIRELLKELSDDETFISEDEPENKDFIEVQKQEFTDCYIAMDN
ncbi:hypothetical protein TNCT_460351 [Trichonephila clavata]|uniref:Uncharacterized protein n=1 Tax=Trichonephila clavata TaxID=2740835 RepID=A0A8X6F4G7_TRICU|nr:hypothetical protein TNCT_460351 [Trichonephila clavata]